MEFYKPPLAPVGTAGLSQRVSTTLQVVLLPFISLGVCGTWLIALYVAAWVPLPAGSWWVIYLFSFCESLVLVTLSSVPWWFPIAWIYGRRAFVVGTSIGMAPALLRFFLEANFPASAWEVLLYFFETVGLALTLGLGAQVLLQLLDRAGRGRCQS